MRRALFLLCLPAFAQWPAIPTKGIPRLPDGKPNLDAPTPKTATGKPDFSGLWQVNFKRSTSGVRVFTDAEGAQMMKPAAAALYARRQRNFWADDNPAHCLPLGIARYLGGTQRIAQADDLLLILNGANPTREIFLDGRAFPVDPLPTWLGYSVGRWEGEALVVETRGLNGRQWLDNSGHPLTEQARVVERFRRVNFGTLQVESTIDDPGAYTAPFTIKHVLELYVDGPLLMEFVCNEGNTSVEHLVR